MQEIGEIIKAVKEVNPAANVMVDNCYGEFTDVIEPTHVGADIIAGSLIKNPGGGIAPTGGYVAGRAELVERAAMRLTTPGIGGECGSTLGNNRLLFQGLFMAPHIVAQALKTAVFCAGMMEEIGIESSPSVFEKRSDIIQMVKLGNEQNLYSGVIHRAFGRRADPPAVYDIHAGRPDLRVRQARYYDGRERDAR